MLTAISMVEGGKRRADAFVSRIVCRQAAA